MEVGNELHRLPKLVCSSLPSDLAWDSLRVSWIENSESISEFSCTFAFLFRAVTDEGESSLAVTAHADKANMWISCTFLFESEEPFNFASVMIRPTTPPDMSVVSVA